MKQWDRFHKKRAEDMGDEPPHKAVVEMVKILRENKCKKILDHGCGTGRNLQYLRREGFDVYGIDKSKFALDFLIEQGIRKDHMKSGDIIKLPYKNNFFDALISVNVIPHGNSRQVKRYIHEIKRVVRGGGVILFVVCSPKFLDLVKTHDTKKVDDGTYVNLNTPDGNLEHHFFTTEEMETFFKNDSILKNEYVDEYSIFMKQLVNHLHFVCIKGK